MSERYPRLARLLLASVLLLTVSPGEGAAQTAQACLDSQLRAAGTACRGVGKCYVKAMKKGVDVDPSCILSRSADLYGKFGSVESTSNCLVEPGSADVWTAIEDAMSDFESQLDAAGGKCAAKKMGGLGKGCKQLHTCYAEAAAASNSVVDLTCINKAKSKIASVFEKAEKNGVCDGDVTTMTDDDADLAEANNIYLLGSGTTSTTTSTTNTSTTTSTSTTSTTLLPESCPDDGSFTPCYAYRDVPACKACVDATVGPDAGVATTLCTGAGIESCGNSYQNAACGYAINTATTCALTCCP